MPTLAPQLLLSRLGKVCVAITGMSAAEMIQKASVVVRETLFLEFRLDYLDDPLADLPVLGKFLLNNPSVTAIATCRRVQFGGHFGGELSAEVEILLHAGQDGFAIVDLELESAELLKKEDLAKLQDTGAALLVSHHDFEATRDLDAVYQRILPFRPDFAKIVPTARVLADNVVLMRFLEQTSNSANVIGICMGEMGIISRVLGVRAGSLFTFAAASQGEETGPGQIAAHTLLETYRVAETDAATKVYGVAGNPIQSSLSPTMMNTAFRRETMNAVYLPLKTETIDDLLKITREIPLQGLSITMPLKQSILPYLERTDPLSSKIGACNTVLRAADGKLYGFNTDVAGIVGPLEKRGALRDAKILVLGAGGAARAAVFGLKEKGAEVMILNRNPETAQKLAKQAGAKVQKREALGKTQFDVIVNATPVGMAHGVAHPLLEDKELRAKLVFDLVYNPIETPLLRLARAQGIAVIAGVEMFVQQGARQFEIWTGKPAPEEEMLHVVVHAMRQQAETRQLVEHVVTTNDRQ